MADFVFNVALGRGVEWINNVDTNSPTNSAIGIMLLATTGLESNAVLKDVDTVAALVAGTTNEATNTGYSRHFLVDTDVTWAPDDTNNRVDIDMADQTWTGVANDGTGAIAAFVTYYDGDTTGGTDANCIPWTYHDFAITPDGSDITAVIASAGFFRAS